jgi:acetyltransferase-like isoleucine patch superfamily enzyme
VLYGDVNIFNTDVKIGNYVHIYPNVTFWGNGHIEIGDNCSIGQGTVIFASCEGGVFIGNNTHIAAQCYIIDMDHGIRANMIISNQKNTCEKITICDDVWIAAGAKILKGSVLHDHVVVGANAVVKRELPENSIAVGVPAKVIKYRL